MNDKWQREELEAVPYFDGLFAGEPDALVRSFRRGAPAARPVRGRVKGTRAFEAFVTDTTSWLTERDVSVEDVDFVVTERAAIGEVVLHLDGDAGPVDLPVAIVATASTADGSTNCGSTRAVGR